MGKEMGKLRREPGEQEEEVEEETRMCLDEDLAGGELGVKENEKGDWSSKIEPVEPRPGRWRRGGIWIPDLSPPPPPPEEGGGELRWRQ